MSSSGHWLRRGYTVVGPTVRDQAIVYDEIGSSADLPIGWTDEQDGGHYRLRRREDEALFGYNVGPHSWKRYQLPPEVRLWRARRDEHGELTELAEAPRETPALRVPRRALVRAARDGHPRPRAARRRALRPGRSRPARGRVRRRGPVRRRPATPASASRWAPARPPRAATTSRSPRCWRPIATTSSLDVGSERGAEVLGELPHAGAGATGARAASAAHARAAAQMGRELDVTDIRDLLYRNYENPRWEEVAERCLSCGNCTMVCPTCFCTTVEDVTDLAGEHVERHQRWDSCFTVDYSHIHGGAVRASTRSRYRQWMTHKLATWIDQFGSSGCVGCGRCITWCPVGIDITEEARAIRESEAPGDADA